MAESIYGPHVAPLGDVQHNREKGRETPPNISEMSAKQKMMFDAYGIKSDEEEKQLRERAIKFSASPAISISSEFIKAAIEQYMIDWENKTPNPSSPRPDDWNKWSDEEKAVQLAIEHYDELKKSLENTSDAEKVSEKTTSSVYDVDPVAVMLAHKARASELHDVLAFGIQKSLINGKLNEIVKIKAKLDAEANENQYAPHPPYVRVALTGKGTYDESFMDKNDRKQKMEKIAKVIGEEVAQHLFKYVKTENIVEDTDHETRGSSSILEIWPSTHYSPIHSHGETAGIVYAVHKMIHVMLYKKLGWADGLDEGVGGLVDVHAAGNGSEAQCTWLNEKHYDTHKVLGEYDEEPGAFSATYHAYINQDERSQFVSILHCLRTDVVVIPLPDIVKQKLKMYQVEPSHNRDVFNYAEEYESKQHEISGFGTLSDLRWDMLLDEILLQIDENYEEFSQKFESQKEENSKNANFLKNWISAHNLLSIVKISTETGLRQFMSCFQKE